MERAIVLINMVPWQQAISPIQEGIPVPERENFWGV